MFNLTSLMLLPQAATAAGPIDLLILAITVVTVVFSVLIAVAIVYFATVYRRGRKVDRSNPPMHNNAVEITWTVIPLVIAMGIFFWSSALFLAGRRMPAGAMEIYVVGKQWMWKMQHPEGRWENNELHVPVGRTIKLTMTSADVIHAFFVPAFRLKMDVIPGQYTYLWFTPTKVGTYNLFCAEFCGTLHSGMIGTVTVMEPAQYERWLNSGTYTQSLAAAGEALFRQHGCSGCHAGSGSVRAPSLEGIFGKPQPVQIPPAGLTGNALRAALRTTQATQVLADQRYIHDSILLPEQEIAAGYDPIMPSYKNRLTEEEIFRITTYIQSLGASRGSDNRSMGSGRNQALTAEEYRARTGFVPQNVPGGVATGAAGATGGAAGGTNRNRSGRIGGGSGETGINFRPTGNPMLDDIMRRRGEVSGR